MYMNIYKRRSGSLENPAWGVGDAEQETQDTAIAWEDSQLRWRDPYMYLAGNKVCMCECVCVSV